MSPSDMPNVGKLALMSSLLVSSSTDPFTATPPPSMTRSSIRVEAPLRVLMVKDARAGFDWAFTQPGSRLSILAWVRSASIANRLS